MKIRNTSNLCIKKCCEERHVDLSLIGGEGKSFYQNFNIFMSDHTSHRGRKNFLVIVYKHLVQKKYSNAILKTALSVITNKEL